MTDNIIRQPFWERTWNREGFASSLAQVEYAPRQQFELPWSNGSNFDYDLYSKNQNSPSTPDPLINKSEFEICQPEAA